MWDFYTAVGLGQSPKIGFPGAVAGTVHPVKKWMPTDQARIAFGYGISASLFQVARAYTVFARDGELVPLTIERSLKLSLVQECSLPRQLLKCGKC